MDKMQTKETEFESFFFFTYILACNLVHLNNLGSGRELAKIIDRGYQAVSYPCQ